MERFILLFIFIRDSIDYKNPSPEQMRERIMKKIRNGSIMLFHSGAKNTPAALPLVIEAANQKGYGFVKVSELIHKKPYVVDHEGRQLEAAHNTAHSMEIIRSDISRELA